MKSNYKRVLFGAQVGGVGGGNSSLKCHRRKHPTPNTTKTPPVEVDIRQSADRPTVTWKGRCWTCSNPQIDRFTTYKGPFLTWISPLETTAEPEIRMYRMKWENVSRESINVSTLTAAKNWVTAVFYVAPRQIYLPLKNPGMCLSLYQGCISTMKKKRCWCTNITSPMRWQPGTETIC